MSGRGRKNIFQYGLQVPQTPEEAERLDIKNSNKKWKEAKKKDVSMLFKNETFREATEADDLSDYKLIPLLTKYTVKADGKHKVKIVARGHRTGEPEEDVYDGHMKGESVRVIFLIASKNDLNILM